VVWAKAVARPRVQGAAWYRAALRWQHLFELQTVFNPEYVKDALKATSWIYCQFGFGPVSMVIVPTVGSAFAFPLRTVKCALGVAGCFFDLAGSHKSLLSLVKIKCRRLIALAFIWLKEVFEFFDSGMTAPWVVLNFIDARPDNEWGHRRFPYLRRRVLARVIRATTCASLAKNRVLNPNTWHGYRP
jgi:hypothetical protein